MSGMVNFVCPAYSLFLSVPVRLFPGETITRIGGENKTSFCPHVGGHQPIIWVPEQNKEGGKRRCSPFFLTAFAG